MKPHLILLEKRVSLPPGAALGRQEHGALLCELADDISLLENKKKSGKSQRNKTKKKLSYQVPEDGPHRHLHHLVVRVLAVHVLVPSLLSSLRRRNRLDVGKVADPLGCLENGIPTKQE